MMDQAEKLRQIISNLKTRHVLNQPNPDTEEVVQKTSRVIAVTSGKGGVGKSNITVNLAIALSELGKRVTILDADLGLANVDVILGIVPQFSLVDVIYKGKNIFDVLTPGPSNVKFVSGGSGVEELVKLEKDQLEKFITNINLLDKFSDIILIDTGAGLSDNVMSFVLAADEVIVVTTPEPTSITDAYALIKSVANKDKEKIINVVVNRAENSNEASIILNRLQSVTERFLKIKLQPLGYVVQDDSVSKAVKMQQPFSLCFPKSDASKLVKEISKKMVFTGNNVVNPANTGIKNFVSRFMGLFNN